MYKQKLLFGDTSLAWIHLWTDKNLYGFKICDLSDKILKMNPDLGQIPGMEQTEWAQVTKETYQIGLHGVGWVV